MTTSRAGGFYFAIKSRRKRSLAAAFGSYFNSFCAGCDSRGIEAVHTEKITDAKVRSKIIENSDLIRRNIALIKLRSDLPGKYLNINDCCLKKSPDYTKLDKFCVKYGLNAIRKELAAEATLPCEEEKAEMVQDDLFGF